MTTPVPAVQSFVFLSPGALAGPAALAGAFMAVAAAPEPNAPGIANDLSTFVNAAGEFGMAARLRNFATTISPDPAAGLSRRFSAWEDVRATLFDIPQTVLDRARGRLFPREAFTAAPRRSPSGAIVSYVPQQFAITVEGVPVEIPSEDVAAFEIIDPPERVPVANPAPQRAAAIANMEKAIEYLMPSFLAEQASLLSRHIGAIISGEIGAGVELRTRVIEFVAEDVAHAEAYGARVLQDAALVDLLKPPLPVIPKLAELAARPKPWEAEKTPEIPRATAALFSLDDLFFGKRALERLLHSDDPAIRIAMERLAEQNPEAFSERAITRLINAATVVVRKEDRIVSGEGQVPLWGLHGRPHTRRLSQIWEGEKGVQI